MMNVNEHKCKFDQRSWYPLAVPSPRDGAIWINESPALNRA